MERISKEELQECLKQQRSKERMLDLSQKEFVDMDLTGINLEYVNFDLSAFRNVVLNQADFRYASIENALMDGCPLQGANFQNCNMTGVSMRYCDMTGCDIRGANLYCAVLEYAKLDGMIADEHTQWFRMHCPETGPILGYKKCVNDRLVQLLIPADAKRTSATRPSCRCNKAKVLTIKSFDDTEEFQEAWSLVDENFVYKKGEWVEVKDFNEDRWMDSTTGIHFWLTKAEAIGY